MSEFIVRAEETDLFFLFKDFKELTRCKDCAKRTFTKCPMAIGRQSDYDFCSRAERKEK